MDRAIHKVKELIKIAEEEASDEQSKGIFYKDGFIAGMRNVLSFLENDA
tara:strand:+ start:822 stop:968 length:147 start_codon:yes stop_codon:yes gene_type:complete